MLMDTDSMNHVVLQGEEFSPSHSDSLIEHSLCVDAGELVENVYQSFQYKYDQEFVAVVDQGKLLGLVGRGHLGFLLGSRYGFGLYARHAVALHMIESHSSFCEGTPLLEILKVALSRDNATFYNDVIITDRQDIYVGLVSMKKLVRLQSQLIHEQFQLAETQRRSLEIKNSQLFQSVHELKQSQGKLGILFENSALGVALLNARGEIESCNSRTQSLLGITTDHGHHLDLASLVPLRMRRDFLDQLHRHESGAHDCVNLQSEFILELPVHGPRLFRMFSSWINETGQICVLLDDITEQRLLERRVAQEERSILLESLAGGIAHEINNKLSPILGYTELLLERTTAAGMTDLGDYCKIIRDCATESSKIIGQLLQLTRPPNSEKSICDLCEISHAAVAIVKFQLRKVDVEVIFDFAESKLSLIADPSQLKQVLINLLINASHAVEKSPVRQIRISARIVADSLLWTITDTGHGIRPEHLRRIFDPFFSTKGPSTGTGLGLSVCLSIIEQHKGSIDIKSEVNLGTQFLITLPRVEAKDIPTILQETAPAYSDNLALRSRVLVVDDEEFITSLIHETLRTELRCHVERASNGLKAIELLQTTDFDLIISDVRMAGMDGFALLDWVQANLPALLPHFFFITGDAGSADLNQKLETLGVEVLRKPFKMARLLTISARLLRRPPEDKRT